MTKTAFKEEQQPVIMIEPTSKITMLSAIETILDLVEDSAMADECIDALEPYLTYITNLQGITSTQAILLSIVLEGSSDGNVVSFSNIARYLACKRVHVMKYQEDIDELVKRKLLRKIKKRYSNDGIGYVVPENVVNAIKKDIRFVPKPLTAKDGIHFFHLVYLLTRQRKEDEIDTEQLIEEFQELLEANSGLRYVKILEKLNLPLSSQLMVTHIARRLVLNQEDFVTSDHMSFLFDDQYERYHELSNLEEGHHILMKKNIVQFDGSDEFMNTRRYKLTPVAKEKLLKGYPLPKKTVTRIDVKKADSIVEKQLFYNDSIRQQMEQLEDLLSVEKMASIQTRLKEHGRRTGFACLFYGSPGTGKTESVLQLAHKTGRDIMLVDMSEIRSKWVGESEQNIKAVFDNYRALCENSKNTPILLFNEADAILGTRMGNVSHSVDIMNNTIQNIVLQEMETLDGIMIATTNLENNLDGAFERRFIYKVRFDMPDIHQRKSIWQSMLPTLNDDEAIQLATDYNFSGGQIENIARKCDVESILYGESAIDADRIKQICQEENIQKRASRIGFVQTT